MYAYNVVMTYNVVCKDSSGEEPPWENQLEQLQIAGRREELMLLCCRATHTYTYMYT